MRVTYTPEDGEEQVWDFDPRRVRQSEAEMIEKRAGCRWDEWVTLCKAEQAGALRVLLWHLMRRQHPALRFDDVPDFYMGEISVDLDLGELRETRAEVEKRANQFSEDELARALAEIDREVCERMARGEVELGKASARTSADATASPSPSDSA